MSQTVLYFLHNTLVLSFYTDTFYGMSIVNILEKINSVMKEPHYISNRASHPGSHYSINYSVTQYLG